MSDNTAGNLSLGNILQIAGIDPSDVMVIRHTSIPVGQTLLDYSREQDLVSKIGRNPPKLWLIFLAITGRRARFLTAYENHGEVDAERTSSLRYFDLQPSEVLSAMRQRLVIEWSADFINWAKPGSRAVTMPVVDISDPHVEPFPGFDAVLISFVELQAVIEEDRFSQWRTALSSVQGIYLITDTKTGGLYVGKADGFERFLGRWTTYAKNGHGGNVALRELAEVDLAHREHFLFSILQVFAPSAPGAQVDAAEVHFKRAMLTREFGLNRN